MKYYKCVSLRNGDRTSLVISKNNLPDYVITYKPYRWITKIEGTLGIFVFTSLSSAIRHAEIESGSFEIWECEVKNPREVKRICSNFFANGFEKFYFGSGSPEIEPPSDTVVCDKIKMTKITASRKNFGSEVIMSENNE